MQPTPVNSPIDVAIDLVYSVSTVSMAWALVTIGAVYFFYHYGIRPRKDAKEGWQPILFWLLGICGWLFYMYISMWQEISDGQALYHSLGAVGLIILSCIMITTIGVWLLLKNDRWGRIFSGLIVGVIGFGMLATFGTSRAPLGYSLLMGSLLGFFVGQMIGRVLVFMNWATPTKYSATNAGSSDGAGFAKRSVDSWSEVSENRPKDI